jgi:EAL domain-containing protein (putative c-di-GMP-specific phosphodiesterase class I)
MSKPILERLLDPYELSVLFQPIFQIQAGARRVHSVEALIRGPRGTHFERADILFDYVRRKKAEAAVDQSCLTAICDAAKGLPAGLRINVNVHAATLGHNSDFIDFFRRHVQKQSLAPEWFTLELVEYAPTCNISELTSNLAKLRSWGVRIALDDVGLGQSNYRMMLDCHPEYFKLDAYFAHDLTRDSKRCAVVGSLVALAKTLESSVVAEGVAASDDLLQLEEIGVEFAQANLLCPAIPLKKLLASSYLDDLAFDTRGRPETKKRKVHSLDSHRALLGLAAGESFYT